MGLVDSSAANEDGFGGYGRPKRRTRDHSWRRDRRPLAVLEAVEDELDARRDAQLIENFQQIISHNFLDGADGLASGVAGIIGVTYALLPWPVGDRLAPAIAWTLAGACAGFLLSNFPPAKIFLGDSGSTVLGLSIGFLSLSFYRSPFATGPRLLLPLVVAGLPLLDAGLTVIRRVRGRVSPFYGDRRHIYDLLGSRGVSARAVALVCYATTMLLGLIGLIGLRSKPVDFFILASVGVVTLLIAAVRMGALRLDRERIQRPKVLTETSH
jgi:glycosyl transferase family 4